MKKLLALVLALVMTLGLATVGASATDFKDDSSIEYTEAVKVMNGIGVIQGDDNGNFNPTGTLTREQAAKIVAYMLLGQKGADSLSASAKPFDDVEANRWSAGAIAYCATEGIIAGLGNGQFNPEGKLTGHQFAKMLLVALGYNPTYENMVGTADWAVNVAKLAVSAGLEDDLSIAMSNEITRDQAAMMAFNTLKSDLVEYNNPINVKTGDGTEVIVNAKREKSNDVTDLYDDRNTDAEDKFCEKYFKDLKCTTVTGDFGEPCNQWHIKGTDLGTYAKSIQKTLTGAQTYEDIYKAVGEAAMKNLNSFSLVIDGYEDDNNGNAARWSKSNDDDLVWNNAAGTGVGDPTGNGVITRIFVESDTNFAGATVYNVYVVINHIYTGKVSSVTAASGSDARKVTITTKTAPSNTYAGRTLDTDFETEEFQKDDIVTFTATADTMTGEAKIQTMKLATLVSGVELSKTSIQAGKPNKTVATAGGKDYKFNYVTKLDGTNMPATGLYTIAAASNMSAGDKFDFYLDENDMIVYAELTEEELNLKNYLVLTKGAMAAGTASNPTADAVTLDGVKLTNITITKLEGTSINNWNELNAGRNDGLKLNKIYKYTVSGSNYELKEVSGRYDDATTYAQTYKKGASQLGGYVANSATKLYVYDLDDSGVKSYTGIGNFPNVTAGTGYKLFNDAGSATATWITGTTMPSLTPTENGLYTGNTNAVAVLYKASSSTVLAAVVVHNSKAAAADVASSVDAKDIVYVTSKNYVTTKDGDDEVYTFDVIKNGKVTTLSTKSEGIRDTLAGDQDLYLVKSYDGDYADSIKARTADGTPTINAAATPVANGGLVDSNTNMAWGRVEKSTYGSNADVTSGTFKVEVINAAGNVAVTHTIATDSSTKFFQISKDGDVTEISADDLSLDLVKAEFSVIADVDSGVGTATYVFYQKT